MKGFTTIVVPRELLPTVEEAEARLKAEGQQVPKKLLDDLFGPKSKREQ